MPSSFPRKRKTDENDRAKKRKEKKGREGKMEIFQAPCNRSYSLSLYIFHNVRIARVLIKKRKSRLRRRKYTKLDHRGFHRKRRMFSQRMIEKLLRQ